MTICKRCVILSFPTEHTGKFRILNFRTSRRLTEFPNSVRIITFLSHPDNAGTLPHRIKFNDLSLYVTKRSDRKRNRRVFAFFRGIDPAGDFHIFLSGPAVALTHTPSPEQIYDNTDAGIRDNILISYFFFRCFFSFFFFFHSRHARAKPCSVPLSRVFK